MNALCASDGTCVGTGSGRTRAGEVSLTPRSTELFRREALAHQARPLGGGDAPGPGLGRRRPRKIPFIQQLTDTDCGAACLAMALASFGRRVPLRDLRDSLGTGRDGANARQILEAAQRLGLRGVGVRLELDATAELDYVGRGAILHWEFNHFVVFDRRKKGGIIVLDPAAGRRFVPDAELRRAFTGVALAFQDTDLPLQQIAAARPFRKHAFEVLRGAGLWAPILVTSLVLQVVALALPLLTGEVVDRVIPARDTSVLELVAMGLAAIAVFDFILTRIRGRLLQRLRTRIDAELSRRFVEHLLALPYAFFQRRPVGDLVMRLQSNATIREVLTGATLSVLLDGALVVGYLVLLLGLSPGFGVLTLVAALAQGVVLLVVRRRQHELLAAQLQEQGRTESYQVQMVQGIETLKAAGAEDRAVAHWTQLFGQQLRASEARGLFAADVDAIGGALRLLAPLALLVFGTHEVLNGRLSLGEMLGLSALAGGFLAPVGGLLTTVSQLQLLGGFIERIDDVLATPRETMPGERTAAPALTGAIALDHVSFAYSPQGPPVLTEVSVAIAAGQMVALVGRTGSGKSTLASLLVCMHRPSSGAVRYDGEDLASLDLRSLRRQIGVVTQHPSLFGTSIRANIALSAPDATIERVVVAAAMACVHDDITAMPLGYETPLFDGGASLSGGQRQRLALARALLHQPRILLLDEATSSLDALTEAAVHRNLASLGCTRIVIAHRMSTIVDADVILVLDEGRIVEQGSHATLMAADGLYAALVRGRETP